MKKFFAIFAAACLLAIGNVFANTWTSPNDQTAYFTLGVFCEPALTGGTSVNFGTYFTDQTGVDVSSASEMTWYLTGPNPTEGASYQVQGTGHTGDLTDNTTTTVSITATGGTGGNSVLHGYWSLPPLTTQHNAVVNCTANNTDCPIQFYPTSLDTHGTGDQTFALTLTVVVTV
jgi:hypothetical protein